MANIDLNLLVALDALLAEGSVTGAAKRLHLSAPAMSRTLARIRVLLQDPVLVRSGRSLVPTARADGLRDRLRALIEEAQAIVSAEAAVDLGALDRTFTLHTNDGFVETFGARILRGTLTDAPGVRLRFLPRAHDDETILREGKADLETGASYNGAPELRMQALFRDRFVGAVRIGHPLADGLLTPEKYASYSHISASRRGCATGPIDLALESIGLRRRVVAIVPGFSSALALARESDLVANVPGHESARGLHGLVTFPLPVETPRVTVSQFWHPRMDADRAHQWLRRLVRQVCAEAASGATRESSR